MNVTNPGNSPCRYLTETPQKNLTSYNRKALLYNVLEKITWVAVAAICAAAYTIYYTGYVLPGAPFFAIGAVVSLMALVPRLVQFRVTSNSYARLAKTEEQVIVELGKISHWKNEAVQDCIRNLGLDPAQIPLETLQKVKPEEPLTALLPLIARFNVMRDTAIKVDAKAKELLGRSYNDIQDQDEKDNKFEENQNAGTERRENFSAPFAANAVAMLRMIQDPTVNIPIESQPEAYDQKLDEHKPNLEIQGLGKCRPKRFGMRQISDNYFFFNEKNRAPLPMTEIQQNIDPIALYSKFYPRA
jgi:hypothetical protein